MGTVKAFIIFLLKNKQRFMAIFLSPFGDNYAEGLAQEYQELSGEKSTVHYFCTKTFTGGEQKIRFIDEHCGMNGLDCDLSCDNPIKLGEKIENSDVYVVLRGKYGKDWNSDRLFGMACQATEVLKRGSPEYLRGKRAGKVILVMTHEPYTKQDHLFTDIDGKGKKRRYEGEAITLRMNRGILQGLGCDHIVTVYPHDYRREGWVRKVAMKGEEDRYLTDWRRGDRKNLIELENWTNFVFSVDPTDEIAHYIRTNKIPVDVVTAPDPSGNTIATMLRRALGVWEPSAFIEKHRSRANADNIEVIKGFDPELVRDKNVVIVDDWALTSNTFIKGVESAFQGGARHVDGIFVHGAFVGDSVKNFKKFNKGRRSNILDIHTMDTIDNPYARIPTAKEVAERLYYLPEMIEV
ncbi:MAG: hypothetical protein ABIH52_03835 [Candidatus Aenigmatarchaeota archaeon]